MPRFRVSGLEPQQFAHLFGLPDEQLTRHGARRYVVDEAPGFPDRIEMRDLEPGERALLVNFEHQPADTPYRSSHAIFVLDGARAAYCAVDEIPAVMRIRLLSVRAFDAGHMMAGADVVDGKDLEDLIERFFADPEVAYLHVHNAKRGCYSGRIDRA